MLNLSRSVHRIVASASRLRLAAVPALRSYSAPVAASEQKGKKNLDLGQFVDDVLGSNVIYKGSPSISRRVFETGDVASFEQVMKNESVRSDDDVMYVMGHLISLSASQPAEVAAWVQKTNFPSVIASHILKPDASPANVFTALGALYVLGSNRSVSKAEGSSFSILHSFETLIPELVKRLTAILEGDQTELPISAVISFAALTNRLNVRLGEKVSRLLREAVELNVGAVTAPADVLAILGNMDLSKGILQEQVLAKANELIPVMSNSELVAILKYLAVQGRRDMVLLPPLTNALARSQVPFTVNNITAITYAVAKLNYRDASLLKRLSQEIQMNAYNIPSWQDMKTLMGSLNRLGIGDKPTWDCLVKWMGSRLSSFTKAHMRQCLLACAMANLESKDLTSIGLSVASQLEPSENESTIEWLNTLYALSLLGALKQTAAEKMLRKEFLSEVANSKEAQRSPSSLLLYKLKIAQINSSTKYDLENYTGTRLSQTDIFGESVPVEEIIRLKRGKQAPLDEFVHVVSFLASTKHISKPMLTQDSILVDGLAELDKKGTYVAVKDWQAWLSQEKNPEHRYLAFVFVPYNRTVRDPRNEGNLRPTGDLAMEVKHLEVQGFVPVVFYEQELPLFTDKVQRIKLVKERVASLTS
ncbi:hypothetical protein L596_006258 [Steinernema carpocapsae]|uniref:RAP domain-containing protein n=1 Tax=Steinernema carpocapsae TaxID=34508 RepID=A0A4U8V1I8_STECR|nr:hypothetical protein L596_006258 [Steinernema carpocapsae]